MRKIFWLKDLGKQFLIERTEDYDDCQGDEKSYGEMIRVKGSRESFMLGTSPLTGLPHKVRYMPSHLYKYSETHLALYMKDHKSIWPKLAEITGVDYHGFDCCEEDFIFPISKFPEVAKIITFRQRRKISEERKEKLRKKMVELNSDKLNGKTRILDKSDRSLNTNFADSDSGRVINSINGPGSQSFQKSITEWR